MTPTTSDHHAYDHAPAFFTRWLCSTNHKDIGTLNLVFALASGLIGSLLSLIMRAQLAHPTGDALANGQGWNMIITVSGILTILFSGMPALISGLGNWFVPLMIGAPDMAFPRLNNISFWLQPPAFALVTIAISYNEADAGWPLFVQLANTTYQLGWGGHVLLLGLHLVCISYLLGAVNFITTIVNLRAPGMTMHKMPLFVWSILVTAFLLLVAVPVLAAAIITLITDRNRGVAFSEIAGGGNPVLFRHLFWFLGNPEFYITILPSFGIVSHIISTFSSKRVFSYLGVAYAMVTTGVVGFVGWAHYLFSSDTEVNTRAYVVTATVVILVATGVQIFSWIATMWGGTMTLRLPMVWALGFIFIFIAGSVAEVALANAGFDQVVHNTGHVVANFNFVLSLAAVFATFAGFYFWIGKISGKPYPRFWGHVHFWLFFIGVNLAAVPMHFLELVGMPGRFPFHPCALADWNLVASLGASVSALWVLVFFWVLIRTFRSKERVPDNEWGEGATTLEWTLSSPPPFHTFTE